MDLTVIKEAFADDPEALLDELGLEYKTQSHRLTVLCPFHADNHLGNAVINNGHFHCFACNTSGDCFSIVQRVLNLSFRDAVNFCAGVYGVQVTQEETSFDVSLRLKKAEMEALMFPKTAISLSKVLKTDAEAYKSIVCKQADLMIRKYQDVISNFGSRGANKAFLVCRLYEEWTPNTYVDIKRESENKIKVLNDLKRRMLK